MIFSSIFCILIGALIFLPIISARNVDFLRVFGLIVTGAVFLLSLFLLDFFCLDFFYFQNVITYNIDLNVLNTFFSFGIDGVSVFFYILSSFLIFLCCLFIWDDVQIKDYIFILISLDLFLLLVFSTLDILLFYIFFEAILIPMFIMIGVWGSRERKIRAVFLFFFFTLVGSLCLLLGLLYIHAKVGTLNYEVVYRYPFSFIEQYWLWLAFFLSFASKIPLFPFHIWLPEAHVEAPTVGSVLLAGILLKLGVYGFLRFNLTLFPDASFFFTPFIYCLSIIGVIYASLTAVRQTDLKRVIAYSSVAHMNLVTMGIFSFNVIGLEGSILQSISHGFVSGALFFLVGILYKRYHSRLVYYFSGLTLLMPVYSLFFFLFTLANIALPGTSSFVGEFLLLLGIFKTSVISCFLATLGVILCGTYSLWVYNRICFGNLKINNVFFFKDIELREGLILIALLLLVLFAGVYPIFFLNFLHFACTNYLVLFL